MEMLGEIGIDGMDKISIMNLCWNQNATVPFGDEQTDLVEIKQGVGQ